MAKPHQITPSGTHYTREGDGPTLLFIHGAGGNAAVWFQQVEAFAGDYTVICLDLPGFGLSQPREMDATHTALAAIVLEVMDHAEIERATLVGQSLGGWFALRAALAAPQRVDRLVLSCTMAGVAHDPAVAALSAAFAGMGSEGLAGMVLSEEFERGHTNKALLFRQITAFNPPLDPAAIGALFAPQGLLPKKDLARLDCPVLMISGEDDPIWPPDSLEALAEDFANAEQVITRATGHSPYFERPSAFNRELADFLRC